MSRDSAKVLLTAAEVARYCHVDLKTIHNWAEKKAIHHHRTPGRHLRFRRLDVVDFLRTYGYPIPEDLRARRPKLALLLGDPMVLAWARRAFSRRFDLTIFTDPVDALVGLAALAPDALVLDVSFSSVDGLACVARLAANPATRHIRIVALGPDDRGREPILAAGASGFVHSSDAGELRETLDRVMGLDSA